MNQNIANFYWEGELTKLEKSCLNSFTKNNFTVNLWTYSPTLLDNPQINICDANLIINKDHKPDLQISNSIKQDIHNSQSVIFSDLFRLNLLSKIGGWWFDADCFCLKDASEFNNLQTEFTVGRHDDNLDIYNNAVLSISPKHCKNIINNITTNLKDNDSLIEDFNSVNTALITKYAKKHNIKPLNKNIFYPFNHLEAKKLLDLNLFSENMRKVKNSYILHVYHSVLLKEGLDKNNPPEGSILKYYMDKYEK